MRFGVLGPVEVWDRDGTTVGIGGPKVRALLAALLLGDGRVLPLETLIDRVYGQDPPARAVGALQGQVSRLRHGLRGLAEVELLPAGYRLAVAPGDLDAEVFTELVTRAGGRSGEARLALLDEALRLWRGAALSDVPEAADAALPLEEARIGAAEARAETLITLGRHAEAVAALRALDAERPLRERTLALLMRALHGDGRQAEALELYETTRRALADELGADPGPDLAAAHLGVLRGVPETAPVQAPRPRLPAPLTGFVGRERDVLRLRDLLRRERLITLYGPGGAGKTRLAVEAVRGAAAGTEAVFGDLTLVPVGGGAEEIVGVLLEAFGLREAGVLPGAVRLTRTDRLLAALAGRDLLLVLDNCEHVPDVAALAARLLGECGGLRILATSREPLTVTGEVLWPVGQLGLPGENDTLADAAAAPAVRLFADRARAAAPEFELTAETLEPVVRICAALDGQPLALELAAARLRSLDVEEVASRLHDRFRLLSRGDRTKSSRHRTLRAVVEWSWELLTPAERSAAARLTVFAGGFTAAAAEAVCAADEDVLLDLADRSLLVLEPGGRFRMLETIAAFCREKLEETGEAAALERAHREHFHALAAEASPRLRTAEQIRWLGLLTADHANLTAALRSCTENAPVDGARMLLELSAYWWLRGLRTEGAAAARRLLEPTRAADGSPVPGLAEEFVACVALLAIGSPADDTSDLLARAEQALYALPGPPRQPFLLAIWAMAAGPPAGYGEDLQRRRSAQFEGDRWSTALMQLGIGYMRLLSGAPDEAAAEATAALDGFVAVGERWGITQSLDVLAVLADLSDDLPAALALRERALEVGRDLGSVADDAEMHLRSADLLLRLGRTEEGRADLERAGELARRAGAPGVLADVHRSLGDLALGDGDLAGAEDGYARALEACPPRWYSVELSARCHLGLARVWRARDDPARAREHAEQARAAAGHPFAAPIAEAATELLTIL